MNEWMVQVAYKKIAPFRLVAAMTGHAGRRGRASAISEERFLAAMLFKQEQDQSALSRGHAVAPGRHSGRGWQPVPDCQCVYARVDLSLVFVPACVLL